MDLKEEIRENAKEQGFRLFGVADIAEIEAVETPPGRGIQKPSAIRPEARSVVVLGIPITDEAMNASISIPTDDGKYLYYNFYYEITEARAWRVARWLWEERQVRSMPTHRIAMKPAAALSGIGFVGHNTQVITPDFGPRVRFVALLVDERIEPDAPYTRDLCADQPRCRERSLCVAACPYRAIAPGPSLGVPAGEKVFLEKCVVYHVADRTIDKRWEKYIRRLSDRGFMECTLCNLACPYGEGGKGDLDEIREGSGA
jgi:epoxyqueuosine reductase